MSLDAYSYCPAGTGKKIKFCCPNNWQDLEKIARLIEGEQFRAALQLVDQLLAKQPTRACLWSYKTLLERVTGDMKSATAAAEEFVSRFPDNPVALAEAVIFSCIQGDLKAALLRFDQSLQAGSSRNAPLTTRQIEALFLLMRRLSELGEVPPVLYWITWVEIHLPSVGEETFALKGRLMGDTRQPLLLREPPAFLPIVVPKDASPEYQQAATAVNRGLLTEARRILRDWIQTQPDAPLPWYLLGMCSLWQADYATAGESLLRYSELTTDEDMSVIAKILSYELKKDPWGDAEDNVDLIYTLPDPGGLKEAMLSDRRVRVVEHDPWADHFDGGPPPELMAILMRRECEPDEWPLPTELKSEAVAILAYFGRQTDRDARLQFSSILEGDAAAAEDLLRQWLGDRELPAPSRVVHGRRSRLLETLAYVLQAAPPEKLLETFRRLLQVWADRPNKALDDLTPRQAAGEPGKRRALKAVIDWMRKFDSPELDEVLDELKAEWNLQDAAPRTSALMEGNLRVPVLAAARVDRSALSDQDVMQYCVVAISIQAIKPARFFAEEAVARRERLLPELTLGAYRFLIQEAEDAETGKRLRDEAVAFAEQRKAPHGTIHLELLRSGVLEEQEAHAEWSHLVEAHAEEPEVEAFLDMLMEHLSSQEGKERPGEPGPAESPGLWTPDGEIAPVSPPEESKSKLWIPGRD
ncbi:MAG: hypothetical protein GYA33_07140 [Thermogutta sp.]|nr:hypothetical protein [Thermogutta sp.]